MSKHALPRSGLSKIRRRGIIALSSTVALAFAGAVMMPANASTTVTPAEPGSTPGSPAVVRDSSVHLTVDVGALTYYRGSSSASFAAQSPLAVAIGATVCRGDSTTNNSPRTTLTVTGPDSTTLLDVKSPVRNISPDGFLSSPKHQPANPQPLPSSSNYRGDFPATNGDNTYHGITENLDLTGKPAGIYTVTTVKQNMVRTGFFGACSIGTPGPGNTVVSGLETSTQSFEYRPWQANFVDVLGKGKVSANVSPSEFTFSIGNKSSTIYANGPDSVVTFFKLAATGFALPSDPTTCATDASSCLPVNATTCDPSAGCTPRVMIVNKPVTGTDGNQLQGVFDLDTKAFIANVTVAGTSRVLMSLGTANDGLYHDALTQLSTAATAQGVDLATILATEVRVNSGGQRTSLSLLNGLQLDPTTSKDGIQISSNSTVQAGVLLHLYSSLRLSGGACVANSANSSTAPNRYTPREDNGYTVTKSDLLPKVPSVGPLGAIAGGPLYHITGKFNSNALVNTAAAVIGVDTAVDEPNGYPVWIEPFVSSPTHMGKPKTMDFLGTGTWSASETPIASGCLVVDLLVGTGVAVFNNPLPVGFGTIFDQLAEPNPAAEQLTDAVNDAVNTVVGQVSANPTVASLLDQITALLPLA